MPGASVVFSPDRPMPRAGVAIAYQNIGDVSNPVALGVVGAVFSADWGPFTVTKMYGGTDVDRFYGTTGNVDTAKQIFYGNAGTVLATRLNGTGGAVATITLTDTTVVTNPAVAPTPGTANTGGTVVAGTYTVAYTFMNANGETLPSSTAAQVVPAGTSTNTVIVGGLPALPTGATGINVYISQVGATTPLYRANGSPIVGSTTTITAIPATSAVQSPATNTASNAVTIGTVTAKNQGVRGNSLSVLIRNALSGVGREMLVMEGTRLWETWAFSSTGDQMLNLATAVGTGSDFVTVTRIAAGNSTVAAQTFTLVGGVNPTSTVTDYVNALGLLEAYDQNLTVTDSEDPTMLGTFQGWVDRVRNEGIRTMFVYAQPCSVPYGDSVTAGSRMYNATTLNDFAMVYVANGFIDINGNNIQGHSAAARVAGMIAGARVTDSMTHATVYQAVNTLNDTTSSVVKNVPTYAQILEAYNDGAVVFTINARGQVQIEYGQTTFRIASTQFDLGWKKIRRVRTRDNLVSRIVALWEPAVGHVNNTPDGRAGLQASAQTVINQMVNEGALISGTVGVSTRYLPAGDSVVFEANVDDADSAEKIGVIFGFRFAPPVPSVR